MAENKYLKQNGEIVYPFTLAQNVLDLKEVVIQGNTATFPDGLIIQGGGQTISNNSPTTITYPKPFPNLCFRAIAWGNHVGFSSGATINTDSITSTTFRIGLINGAGAPMSIQGLAIGY